MLYFVHFVEWELFENCWNHSSFTCYILRKKDKCNLLKYFTTVQIFSAKELAERISKIRDMLSDVNLDWNKRVDYVSYVNKLQS